MAKTKISEYSATSADNTDISNINIAEGCSPANVNNAIRTLMAQLKDQQDGASGDPFTVAGTFALTGGLTLDGSAGTSGQVIVSAGTGNTPIWGNSFPSGGIIMWSGTIATIPSGWLLCNGSSGTPDLRNRFIIGAFSDDSGTAKTTITGSATQTGGSKDAIVVEHTHTGSTNNAGTHNHNNGNFTQLVSTVPSFGISFGFSGGQPAANMVDAGNHNHTFTTDSTGSSGTNANLPPYYALCYIMKS